jgi:hypothetical protein
MGDSRDSYRVLVGRSEGKRALGRPRRRWGDNIKIHLHEIKGVTDWIDMPQAMDRFRKPVNTVISVHLL